MNQLLKKYHYFKVDKLIRDKMPDQMRALGIVVHECVMEPEEYKKRLKDKLLEEAQEVIQAKTSAEVLEELADISEVVLALGQSFGYSQQEIETARLAKRAYKGGFEKRIYNRAVEISSDNSTLKYYQANPDKYPEIESDLNNE